MAPSFHLPMEFYVAIVGTSILPKTTEHYLRLTMSIYPDIERKFRAKMDAVFGEEGNHENH